MRILFVTNFYPPVFIGGYELNCRDIAEGLRANGHTVQVLASDYRKSEVAQSERNIWRTLHIWRVWEQQQTMLTPWVARERMAIQRHNARVVRTTIEQFRPDIVVMWSGMGLGRGLLAAMEQHPLVVYYLLDGWLATYIGKRKDERILRTARRIFDIAGRPLGVPRSSIQGKNLIFNSASLRDQYTRGGVDTTQGIVIHLGIPAELFPLQPQHIIARAADTPARILYSGQIVPHKGVGALVTALATLRTLPGLEQTRLTMVGAIIQEGYGEHLRARIAELGLNEAITIVPRRSREELAGIFREHDLFAFPSEWEEPFALTLLEAMATGIPVVSSLTGGSIEVVRDGENAFAFRAGDGESLARRLADALQSPQKAALIGRRASKEVHRRYTLDVQTRAVEARLKALYDAVAADGG